MRFSEAVFIGCLGAVPVCAAAQDTWMAVMLDGQKVGSMHVTREFRDGGVVTTQALDAQVTRLNSPMLMRSTTTAFEAVNGIPQGFSSSSGEGPSATSVTARRRDDATFQLDKTTQGESSVSVLQWPEGALLPEGQRLAVADHGFRRGSTYSLRIFEPSRQQVADVKVVVVGDESVELPGGTERLHHVREELAGTEGGGAIEAWVDDDGSIRRSIAPMQSFHVEMLACDEACAKAPNQDVDVLRAAMVASPRFLSANLRTGPMRYIVAVRGQRSNPFMDTDEQRVTDLGGGVYQVDTSYSQGYVDEERPTREDTSPNPWVQSDAPEVRALAQRIVGGAQNDGQRMRRLRGFLTDYIDSKGLDVGYATAVETIHSRRGDCTEHAVLLAALARSLHIPARVVTGLVYVDQFGDSRHVFIPHAWVQAWLNERWVSFDSAQGRYDTTHIALAAGDGDPWRFFGANATLGSIDIQQASPMPAVPGAAEQVIARSELARGTLGTIAPAGGGVRH